MKEISCVRFSFLLILELSIISSLGYSDNAVNIINYHPQPHILVNRVTVIPFSCLQYIPFLFFVKPYHSWERGAN